LVDAQKEQSILEIYQKLIHQIRQTTFRYFADVTTKFDSEIGGGKFTVRNITIMLAQ
jgi:hypothetical protein